MKNKKKGFTLVELLAVIVILAIILVIAVPKVMSVITDSKKATLESTVKMIASAAEKAKIQNTVLGVEKEIECEDVVKLNDIDYKNCKIVFDGDTAKVTIEGSGKFAGLNVCGGTKTLSTAKDDECTTGPTAAEYITNLLKTDAATNGLQEIKIEQSSIATSVASSIASSIASGIVSDITWPINAGIRYVGEYDAVKNKVYFNCEDTYNSKSYGSDGYDYANACETWRIIGVFDVEDGAGNTEKRLKIINTESTFWAMWDSSENAVNYGNGVNQWGPSINVASGTSHPGADLYQLLNGYYIDPSGSECKYNNTRGQAGFGQTCTYESLKNAKMKPLTSVAKKQVSDAVWYTYAVDFSGANSGSTAYLQENGISAQHTGKSLCEDTCEDNIKRTTSWTGLVGLMSISDMQLGSTPIGWTISPYATDWGCNTVYTYDMSDSTTGYSTYGSRGVMPTVYLSADVQIIGGDGSGTPYKLSV